MDTMIEDKTKKRIKTLVKESFQNKQLDLFQNFLVNTDLQRSAVSNCIEIWDCLPRYSVSQQTMNKMRDDKGRLDLLEISFNYRQNSLKVIIHPALIQEEKNGVKSTISYYPSSNEELIEEALRKIATIKRSGFHESLHRSGVVFTLYELRGELKKRGHARSYSEIIKSLTILSCSIIEISAEDKQRSISFGKRSAYFPQVSWVNRDDLSEDSAAKWYVQFHPLVTDSIDKLAYRQFNYQQLMSHSTQLARWLHKYLVSRYRMASKMNPFEIRYSTIKRDSAMLGGYKRERQAIEACDFSMNELKTQKIAYEIKREVKLAERNKIIDVIYTITPTLDFIAEVKAANARQGQLKSQ